MENINKIQIVPDEVYEIGADKVPVIPEWSVKDDSTLYEKVRKLAHSTFDRSKFTVVGSPNITDDGIASGLTQSNSVSAITPTLYRGKNNWHLRFKRYWNGSTFGLIRFVGNNDNSALAYNSSWNSIYMQVYDISNTQIFLAIETVNRKLTIGDVIVDIYYSNNTGYYFTLTQGTNTYTSSRSSNTNELQNTSNNLISRITGDIDLKTIQLTVNGVPVFSGNKTGIDTIKPDDYTVVGTPTISADGILSGITNNDYVKFTKPSDFDISDFEITVKKQPSKSGIYLNTDNSRFFLWVPTQNYIRLVFRNNSNAEIVNYESVSTSKAGTSKFVTFKRKNGVVTAFLDGEEVALTETIKSGHTLDEIETISFSEFYVGKYGTGNNFAGYLDLNFIKIYSKGNLVYQPCLKIPYTEGQNYVKVVDKLYRDRVKDLFEQKGYNGYYTIGEDDFTLPSNKWSDVIEHKENGLTVAEQRVDQTLTIRGACEQGVDVNLPMEFFSADSYAVFGVGTTGTNTASKFTPAADGNYIAIGKGKV